MNRQRNLSAPFELQQRHDRVAIFPLASRRLKHGIRLGRQRLAVDRSTDSLRIHKGNRRPAKHYAFAFRNGEEFRQPSIEQIL